MEQQKKKLSRKERRARAELKRKALRVQILEQMQSLIPACSHEGKLNLDKWADEGESYIQGLIKKSPQEAEMIRKVAIEVGKTIATGLEAYLLLKKRGQI